MTMDKETYEFFVEFQSMIVFHPVQIEMHPYRLNILYQVDVKNVVDPFYIFLNFIKMSSSSSSFSFPNLTDIRLDLPVACFHCGNRKLHAQSVIYRNARKQGKTEQESFHLANLDNSRRDCCRTCILRCVPIHTLSVLLSVLSNQGSN